MLRCVTWAYTMTWDHVGAYSRFVSGFTVFHTNSYCMSRGPRPSNARVPSYSTHTEYNMINPSFRDFLIIISRFIVLYCRFPHFHAISQNRYRPIRRLSSVTGQLIDWQKQIHLDISVVRPLYTIQVNGRTAFSDILV